MIGEILKKRREELGKDLREIADSLKIRYDYLKALEEGALDKLPSEVYVKGYIREYAKVLGMDPQAAIIAYTQQTTPSPPGKYENPGEKGVQKRRLRTAYVLVPSLLIASIIVAAFFQVRPANKIVEKAVPVVETKKESAASTAVSGLVLKIVATDTTWLLVTVDKTDSKEILMKPGDSITWHAKKSFSLKIGNAGGIRLIFNGKEISELGEKGQVVKVNLPYVGI